MTGEWTLSDSVNVDAMQTFMRTPAIYWSAADALAPPPEAMNFRDYLQHPDVWTLAAMYGGVILGYIVFIKRTSIGAEIHFGFRLEARGKIALAFCRAAVAKAFGERNYLKLWGLIPSDNRPALVMAHLCGFEREGVLRNAIVRHGAAEGRPPLRDLIIVGLSQQRVSN